MGRDGSGNRVIDGVGLARFAKERAADDVRGVPDEASPTSVRNAFTGIVTALTVDDVVARVEIQSGPHRLVSLVTREAVVSFRSRLHDVRSCVRDHEPVVHVEVELAARRVLMSR